MKKLLIKNIKGLVQLREETPELLRGKALAELPVLENAWLAAEDGVIVGYGLMEDWGGISDWTDLEIIDASGKYVLPAWVDSHTHLVFAATREEEFVDRIKGLTYEEIAAKGGGILNSANKLAGMSEDELYQSTYKRLQQVISMGTGAIEIKSGYGLSVDAELKMLRVIKRLKENSPIPIKSTFLGAHAFPKEFKENRKGYIDLIINEMLPVISSEKLADYIDVFCESNYFSVEETKQILEAGANHGLKAKIHVNQFNSIGGIEMAVEQNALSVDHLEVTSYEDVEVLKKSNTIATLLPSCSFFIKIPYSPARKLIDSNVAVALATDYNPGSTPSGNMNFVNSLACIHLNMTPEEVINASTINASYALELQDEVGSITIGKKANLIITKEMPSLAYLLYSFGENLVERVIV